MIKKFICKLISLLDYIDYKYIHTVLTDGYKTIQEIPINNIKIETDTGYKPVSRIMISKPFEQYIIKLENGYELNCADRHILFDEYYNEVFCEDLNIGDKIITNEGPKKIVSIYIDKTKISMSDITVDDDNHRFYSNGILSHNSTTTAIYCLWVILFNTDKNGLILSKSGPAGQDLVSKIKDMYRFLPYHLKIGTMKWNQSAISFDNNSQISTEPFSPTAGLGKTINFLILDEFAWCPQNDVDLFYNNIIPTVTTISNSNVCIMSTQNGFNLFYEIWKGAIEKRNIYAPFKVDWDQVPQFNSETKQWEKRTIEWKKMMVGVLGSEEKFQYQYGTQFSASDNCLVSRECLSDLHNDEVLYNNKDTNLVVHLHPEFLFFDPDFDLNELTTEWFVILVDLAEGAGQDSTIFHIFKVYSDTILKQVGYWKSNVVDLENAALEFWLVASQLFNNERCLISLEWNTYGALFFNYLNQLNETEYRPEFNVRFNFAPEGFDLQNFVYYKKTSLDDQIPGIHNKNAKTIPGIRFNNSNKSMACALAKLLLERRNIVLNDLRTIGELENFEDKNGNGSYKASFGHDDLIMTVMQIPLLQQTDQWKFFIEEFKANKMLNNVNQDTNYGVMSIFENFGDNNVPSYFQDNILSYNSNI